jgi:hypothetical protein
MTLFLAAPLLITTALLSSACSSDSTESLPDPVYVDEQPVLSGNWVEIDALPAWVEAPPPKEGTRRFVELGRSNLRHIATNGRSPLASKFLTENVRVALEPLIGDEAATATAEDVLAKLVMVHRTCKEEVLTKRPVPGNTLCTAWALWELPLDDAVATVPDGHRAAARELLATIELTTRPEKYQR